MTVRILATADLHLGRRPTRFPEDLGDRISPARVLERVVDTAVARRVDVVVLAGDVVDRRNASSEAWGPLDKALHRLREEGIAAVAVAGNHDAEALPLIARELGGGHLVLLGEGGRWDRWTLRDPDGAARLHIDGWSFPEPHHPTDPTEGWTPHPTEGTPAIGLLHCDLGVPRSPYAPVSEARLRSTGHAAWILGHIHAPRLHAAPGAAPLVYPGSPQGLDPGETGLHGVHLLAMEGGVVRDGGRVELAMGRYDDLEVPVAAAENVDQLDALLRREVTAHLSAAVEATPDLEALRLRLRLTGRSALLQELESRVAALADFDPGRAQGVRVVVDPRPYLDVRPAHDLHRLSREDDAAAMLARLVLDLRGEEGAGHVDEAWLHAAREALGDVAGQSLLQETGLADEVSEAELRRMVLRGATLLLDELLDQAAAR